MKHVFFTNAIWDANAREEAMQRCRRLLNDDVDDINAEFFRIMLLPHAYFPYDLRSCSDISALPTMIGEIDSMGTVWRIGIYMENYFNADLVYMSVDWEDNAFSISILAYALVREIPILFDEGKYPTHKTEKELLRYAPIVMEKFKELMKSLERSNTNG